VEGLTEPEADTALRNLRHWGVLRKVGRILVGPREANLYLLANEGEGPFRASLASQRKERN
jgi:hypothetical protein